MKNYQISPIPYRKGNGVILTINSGALTADSMQFNWTIYDAANGFLETGWSVLTADQYNGWAGTDWPYLAQCVATNLGLTLGDEIVPTLPPTSPAIAIPVKA